MDNTHSLDLESSSSQYADRADTASLSITGDLTLEAWVKPETLSGEKCIVSKYGTTNNTRSYIMEFAGSSLIFGNSSGGDLSSTQTKTATYTFVTGKWYHVACAYDASAGSVEFFVNGISIGTQTGLPTSIHNNASRFAIGSYNNDATPTAFFDGLIDEVRVWDDLRTASEILQNMVEGLTPGTDNLVDVWKLDNDYTSESGNNDLTATNSPVFSTDVYLGTYAQTTKFTPNAGGDGRVYNDNVTYATARNATSGSGNGASETANTMGAELTGGSYWFYRHFEPYDTSALDASRTVVGAMWGGYIQNKDSTDDDTFDIVETTQASPTALANDDFEQLGSTSFGQSPLYSAITSSQWLFIPLTNTTIIDPDGYSLLGMRATQHDIGNTAPTNRSFLQWRTANYADSAYYPVLLVHHAITSIAYTKEFTETLTITDSYVRAITKPYIESIEIVDSIVKASTRIFTDISSISDRLIGRRKRTSQFTQESPTDTTWTRES